MAKQVSLDGTGISPPSHSSGGRGSESGLRSLLLRGLLLADTSEEELDGMSESCGLCVGLPDTSESRPLRGGSSPSTSFVGPSGSRELHAVGAESTAASQSVFGGGGASLAGLRDFVTP